MHDTTSRRLRRTVAGTGLLMGILGSIVGVAFANHQFPDVPNSQAHHANIGRFVDAGCATGFNDGTYRPGDNITRGQAASQSVRCASRVAWDDGTANGVTDNAETVVASTSIRNLATTGDGGLVEVHGTVSANETATNCPCTVRIEILNDTTDETTGGRAVGFETPVILGIATGQASWHAVFELPAGAQHNYDLVASGFSSGDTTIDLNGVLTATYHPMDGAAGIIIGPTVE